MIQIKVEYKWEDAIGIILKLIQDGLPKNHLEVEQIETSAEPEHLCYNLNYVSHRYINRILNLLIDYGYTFNIPIQFRYVSNEEESYTGMDSKFNEPITFITLVG